MLNRSVRKFNVFCEGKGVLIIVKKKVFINSESYLKKIKDFLKKICGDAKTKQHLLDEISLKEQWRNQKIKDFIFSYSQGNTFLEELQPHKNEMNLDINEINSIANGENEQASLKLRSKLLKILEKDVNYEKSFEFISSFMSFLNRRKSYKQEKKTLFDYFLKNDQNNSLKYVLKKKLADKFGPKVQEKHQENKEKFTSFYDILQKTHLFEKGETPANTALGIRKRRSSSLHNVNMNRNKEITDFKRVPETDRGHLIKEKKEIHEFINTSNKFFHKKNSKSLHKIKEFLPLKYHCEGILQTKNDQNVKLKLLKHNFINF